MHARYQRRIWRRGLNASALPRIYSIPSLIVIRVGLDSREFICLVWGYFINNSACTHFRSFVYFHFRPTVKIRSIFALFFSSVNFNLTRLCNRNTVRLAQYFRLSPFYVWKNALPTGTFISPLTFYVRSGMWIIARSRCS